MNILGNYKVGDRVRLIDCIIKRYTGLTGTVDAVDHVLWVTFDTISTDAHGAPCTRSCFFARELEPLKEPTPVPTKDFKPGDKVRRTGDDWRDFKQGEIYTVKLVRSASITVEEHPDLNPTKENFVLVNDTPAARTVFKEGDKVRRTIGTSKLNYGDLCTVVKVKNPDGTDPLMIVRRDQDGKEVNNVYSSNFELVINDSPEAKLEKRVRDVVFSNGCRVLAADTFYGTVVENPSDDMYRVQLDNGQKDNDGNDAILYHYTYLRRLIDGEFQEGDWVRLKNMPECGGHYTRTRNGDIHEFTPTQGVYTASTHIEHGKPVPEEKPQPQFRFKPGDRVILASKPAHKLDGKFDPNVTPEIGDLGTVRGTIAFPNAGFRARYNNGVHVDVSIELDKYPKACMAPSECFDLADSQDTAVKLVVTSAHTTENFSASISAIPPKELNVMSLTPIKLEARTYVTLPNTTTPYNAAELSDDQLIAAIQQSETEIERLGKITAQPKVLKKRVADLQAGIDALVALLDERADAETKKSKK